MTEIDMEMPKYCAECPLMVLHKGDDFFPTYLCKLGWKKLDGEYICKRRPELCPMKEKGEP